MVSRDVREERYLLGPQVSLCSFSVSGLPLLVSCVFFFCMSKDMESLSLLHWQNGDFGKPSNCFVTEVKSMQPAQGIAVHLFRRLRGLYGRDHKLYLQEHDLSLAFNSPFISHLPSSTHSALLNS